MKGAGVAAPDDRNDADARLTADNGPLSKPLGQHLEQPDLAWHPALLGVQHMDRVQTGLPPVSTATSPSGRLASTSIPVDLW